MPIPLPQELLLSRLRDLSRPLYLWNRAVYDKAPSPAAQCLSVWPQKKLGSAAFLKKYPSVLIGGAMAGGISSCALVKSLCEGGFWGSLGIGGLSLEALQRELAAWRKEGAHGAVNLLHQPYDSAQEWATVEQLISHGVRYIEASAFLRITPALVYARVKGLHRMAEGNIDGRRIMAKLSHAPLAQCFFSQAPETIVQELLSAQKISEEEAALARLVPLAEDITAEGDSAGHTDRKNLFCLLPQLVAIRDKAQQRFPNLSLFVGAAGGIGDPYAAHAALALGADYLVLGSILQSTEEAGTSAAVKAMLRGEIETTMAPSPDMFELGAEVQVLKRGSLFAVRAKKLKSFLGRTWEDLSAAEQTELEAIWGYSHQDVWSFCIDYWMQRDASVLAHAEREPAQKLALCLRWYLAMSSRWAVQGDVLRKADFQIWCGPAMGAFNRWVSGSWLEKERPVAGVVGALSYALGALARYEACVLSEVDGLPTRRDIGRVFEQENMLV